MKLTKTYTTRTMNIRQNYDILNITVKLKFYLFEQLQADLTRKNDSTSVIRNALLLKYLVCRLLISMLKLFFLNFF